MKQAGDTIVEVLLCVVVIATVLVGGYSVVNRAYITLEDTQEHSRGVKLAESQVEDLIANQPASPPDCYDFNPLTNTVTPITGSPPNCLLSGNGAVDSTNTQPEYKVQITIDVNKTYTVAVSWQGLRGNDKASLEYRTQ